MRGYERCLAAASKGEIRQEGHIAVPQTVDSAHPFPVREMTQIIGVFRGPQHAPFWHNVPAWRAYPELRGQGELDRCRSRSECDNPTRILTGGDIAWDRR